MGEGKFYSSLVSCLPQLRQKTKLEFSNDFSWILFYFNSNYFLSHMVLLPSGGQGWNLHIHIALKCDLLLFPVGHWRHVLVSYAVQVAYKIKGQTGAFFLTSLVGAVLDTPLLPRSVHKKSITQKGYLRAFPIIGFRLTWSRENSNRIVHRVLESQNGNVNVIFEFVFIIAIRCLNFLLMTRSLESFLRAAWDLPFVRTTVRSRRRSKVTATLFLRSGVKDRAVKLTFRSSGQIDGNGQ